MIGVTVISFQSGNNIRVKFINRPEKVIYGLVFLFIQIELFQRGGRRPVIKNISARTNPTTNKIQAMLLAVPATPDSPKAPAMIATIRNVNAQLIMVCPCLMLNGFTRQDDYKKSSLTQVKAKFNLKSQLGSTLVKVTKYTFFKR